jgi:predicted ATPase/DNA-binding XRE family transcriptional regulator
MEHRRSFGSVLKHFRVAAGLTHEALAERAGLGARTISDLERGVSRAPRADTLALLVEALDLSVEDRALLEAAARPSLLKLDSAAIPLRSRSNLPLQLTTFIGREQEVGAVRRLLCRDDIRLVTLTGPGGVGKTRLAYHVAAQQHDAFRHGLFAAELAPITDQDGVILAIGRAIGEPDEGHLALSALNEAIGPKQLLLILDNCEHLLTLAPLVAELLRSCPRLKVLATSRAALHVSGEQEFPVPPLPVPDPTHLPAVATLADYAAIALFIDRATHVRPDFALTEDNAAAIAAICAQLDGLPLALELAAARVRTLTPRVLLERLLETSDQSALELLAGGPLDAPARHQTLQDTIAWSHELLTPEDQILFRRLAVFVGGCTLEAANAVCTLPIDFGNTNASSAATARTHEIDIVDGLESLVDKSLLIQEEGSDSAPRVRILETIRAYAREQLVAAGEEAELQRRHAEYYLAMVEETGALLFASTRKRSRFVADQGNVQAALHWLVRHG